MWFVVLGGIRVDDDGGGPVALGGRQQRRLLGALLAAPGHAMSADALVEVLWPDGTPDDRHATTLRSYVFRLRASLGELVVRTTESGYRLAVDDDDVDVDRLEALLHRAGGLGDSGDRLALLDEALSLWRGAPYGEFGDEAWCRTEVTRLNELHLVAAERRARAALVLGHADQVVVDLERVVGEHPLRERLLELLVLALYRTGRQVEALRRISSYREWLCDETGLDPGDELVRLERRVLDRDPSLDGEEPQARPARGYVLHEVIGAGAFGTVHRAVHGAVGREVAVKVIRRELADDPLFIRRFETEAQLVASLEHPNIVPVYDYWREPGGAYLVFRLLRGGSAAQRLMSPEPMRLVELTAIVEDVGAALTAAHQAGVVHRDVKPANILFDEHQRAYLADFGIALGPAADGSRVGGDPHGSSLGSPTFASPEQLRDEPATARSDVYAFGRTVYELITRRARVGEEASAIDDERGGGRAMPSVSDVRPDLPIGLDRVLGKSMALEPAERFSTVAAFVAAWLDVVAESPRSHAHESADSVPTMRYGRNPYKGLRAFTEADALDFQGAVAQLARLQQELADARFVAVVGPSGSGKSSLVRAGLLPAVRAGGAFVMTMFPGTHPLDEIETALLRIGVDPPVALRTLLGEERGLVRAVNRVVPGDADVVLLIDQFEELYTLTSNVSERDWFLDALVELVTDPHARVRVVATIRADFYDRPLLHRGLGPALRDHTVPVTPLSASELEQAITVPAAREGVAVERALVAEIVADVSAQPGSLPLLQYTLTELFDRRDGSTMSLSVYQDLGGVAGALAKQAEALFGGLDREAQDAAGRMFARLVSLGDGVADTRRRARTAELPSVPEHIIELFGRHRLVSFDRDPATREPTIEIAHEALMTAWPRLGAWLDEDRDALRTVRMLSDAARAWAVGGRDRDELCRGARLAAALDLVDARPEMLAPAEHEYVEASRVDHEAIVARQRRTARRLRSLLLATAVGLVLAVLAGATAAVQRSRAQGQRSRADRNATLAVERAGEAAAQADAAGAKEREAGRLRDAAVVSNAVTSSQAEQSRDLPLSLLLAVEANRRSDEGATRAALFSALLSNAPVQRFWWGPGQYGAVAATADGSKLFIGRFDGFVERRDRESTLLAPPFQVTTARGSPTNLNMRLALADGDDRLVVAASDGAVTLWDVATRQTIATLIPPDSRTSSLRHDVVVAGRQVYVSSDDGTITAFDARTGTATGVLVTVSGRPERLATDGAGDEVAVAYEHGDAHEYTVVSVAGEILDAGSLDLHGGAYGGWAMSPDGRTVGASTISGGVAVFDVASGVRKGPVERSTVDAELGFLSDDRLLVEYGAVVVVDAASGAAVAGPYPTTAAAVALDRPHQAATLVGADGSIVRFGDHGDLKAGHELAVIGLYAIPDPTGRRLAVATPDGGAVIADTDTGAALTPPLRTPATVASPIPTVVQSVAFNPDGSELAISGLTGTVDVFDTGTGALRRSLPVPLDPSPDPLIAASFGALAEKHTGQVAWSPDGRTIAVGAGSTISMLAADTGTVRARVSGFHGSITSITFGPDSTRALVSGFNQETFVVDADHGTTVFGPLSCDGHLASQGLWLPHRGAVIGAYETATSGTVCALDPSTGTTTVLLHTPAIAAPQTSPDHSVYVGANLDPFGTWVHDIASGLALGKVPGLGILTADGRSMLSSRNGLITRWDLDPSSWPERACLAAGRNLKQEEWTHYFPTEAYRVTCPSLPATAVQPG